MQRNRLLMGIISLMPFCAAAAAPAAAPRYTITDVSASGFAGAEYRATALNNNGDVAGYFSMGELSTYRAGNFLFSGGTLRHDVAPADFRIGVINNTGDFAGSIPIRQGINHAALFRDDVVTDLDPTLWRGYSSSALAMSNRGHVVGVTYGTTGDHRAFLHQDGVLTVLGTLGGSTSSASAVNDRGDVTGRAQTREQTTHAFLYSDGRMIDLGTLGGRGSDGFGINDHGDVVGLASTGRVNERGEPIADAFLYSGGQMRDLGALGSFTQNYAFDINNRGQVVGSATSQSGGASAPFLYEGGELVDLRTLIDSSRWQLRGARSINEAGQILAVAENRVTGRFHPLLLTPIPEPGAAGLLVALGVLLRPPLRRSA